MSIQHLAKSDYRVMPWANGLGQTVEMIRHEDSDGKLLFRISMATVTEDGPFSLFPDIERNLTVLSGDGFDLVEDDSGVQYHAGLLTPVAFAGDVAVTAKNVTATCHDFNVMTRRGLPKPAVWMEQNAMTVLPLSEGQQLALFALSPTRVQAKKEVFTLKQHDLLLCYQPIELLAGSMICVCYLRF